MKKILKKMMVTTKTKEIKIVPLYIFVDFHSSVYHLKEQMSQFFLSNPLLQDEIKFQDLNEEIAKEAQPIENKSPSSSLKKQAEKKENVQNFSPYWGTFSKEIMRNCRKNVKMPPSLESINNRLNIFRAKIDKVDHLELLTRDTVDKKQVKKGSNILNISAKKQNLNKESDAKEIKEKEQEEELDLQNEDDEDIVYYSFKKKMQLALHKRKELERLEKENKEKLKKNNPNTSFESNNSPNKKERPIFERITDKDDKSLEFQTDIGKLLYHTLKQSGDNMDNFKKLATGFIRDYNKNVKEQLYKLKYKNFPPQIPKFTADETKSLNILLPDYNVGMFIQNKGGLFQNLDDVKAVPNTPEYEIVKTMNKIMEGKILQFWKSCQNN